MRTNAGTNMDTSMSHLKSIALRAGLAVIAMVVCSTAAAQGYPNRPIRIVVPYPAGGATDQMARIIQQPLSEILGQPIIIDNTAGAGGGDWHRCRRQGCAGWLYARLRQRRAQLNGPGDQEDAV